ncbi:MAG: hypothetical protein H6Q60_44 [Oscillospiraceae bacterium]|nr:hypothetical protein [Oscillospiraceae bacterium]
MPAQYPYLRPEILPPSPPPRLTPSYCKIAHTQPLKEQFLSQHIRLFIYVWTTAHNSFWMYPMECSNGFLAGYAWQKHGWQYVRLGINQIDSYV